jgi:hypothetical protein
MREPRVECDAGCCSFCVPVVLAIADLLQDRVDAVAQRRPLLEQSSIVFEAENVDERNNPI